MRARAWCVLALALAAGGGAQSQAHWVEIGDNVRLEMSDVLEMAQVNYSSPNINTTYVASSEFDMRAMGPVYNITHLVIDFIANKEAYPEGMVSVSDWHLELTMTLREDWRPLLTHYAGPLAVLTVAALVVVVLPVAGVLWCCCYWCRAGRRRRPFDRKYDACLKALLAILLIGLLTVFLFGIVCAFATDSQVESGAAGAGPAVRAGLTDARLFLNESQAHARHLLVVNYRELQDKLFSMIDSSGLKVSVQLGEVSRASSVSALVALLGRLTRAAEDLRRVHALTDRLRTNAERLNADLRSVKAQLLNTLARCDQPQCKRLQEKHKIGQLDTEIHYSQMPDVSELLSNVSAVLDSNITAEVAAGQAVFRRVQREVQRQVDQHNPALRDAITDTGRRLEAVADKLTYLAGNASARIGEQTVIADTLQDVHAQYGPYRRHLGRAAAAGLLAIMLCMTWGLVCGVCGKRPDVYGASDCCNKGSGSKCLLCGVCLMFAVGGAVSLVFMLYFAAGLATQRLVCDPLNEPRDNRVWSDVERFVQLEEALFNERRDPDFNLTYVMVHCHRNDTLYKTFQLHRLYDVESWSSSLHGELQRRVVALRSKHAPPLGGPGGLVSVLRPAARRLLNRLAFSGLSDFDFDRILDALETNMTSLALDSLSAQLDQAAGTLSTRAGFAEVAEDLRSAGRRLSAAQAGPLAELTQDAAALNETATRLRDQLKFNHSSLKDALSYLVFEIDQAENFFNTQGPELVQNMTVEFGGAVSRLVQQYLSRTAQAARHSLARCGPLSAAFNHTRDAACRNLLLPINGYWVSLAWCLVWLVPLCVLAPRLAALYRSLDPYPGPLVEAEYLYDAYADRDNVPLANAYKAEKRSGRGAARRGAGGGGGGGVAAGGGGGVAPPPAPAHHSAAADAHHARRYNDMAPKHWEEGPPRYHGPTEYERPPPYYYPGPADRQ